MLLMRFCFLFCFVFILIGCQDETVKDQPKMQEKPKENPSENLPNQDKVFPEVKDLKSYQHTEFLPTLEHEINKDKNAIYASSLLFAWEEIRKTTGPNLKVESSFKDLYLINESTSFINTLKRGEYKSSFKVEGILITAKAEFSKSLSFEPKLNSFISGLTFEKVKVSSIGCVGKSSEIIEILYYLDDNHFIIRLKPKEQEHEIILYKSYPETLNTFSNLVLEVQSKIDLGKKEKLQPENGWQFRIEKKDEVKIPKFKFNIENNYNNLINNIFRGNKAFFTIGIAYQKTAFTLNESGAEVKSEAEIIVFADDKKSEKSIIEIPKKLRFDKPFLVLLKRVDNKNPYFAMWVANAELMERE